MVVTRFFVGRRLGHVRLILCPVFVCCSRAVLRRIPIVAPIVAVPIAERDLTPGMLTLRQLKGRTLSVAAARFVDRIRQSLSQRFAPV